MFQSHFNNIRLGTPALWTYAELQVLYSAMDKALLAHGGNTDSFTKAVGVFTIYNIPGWDGGMAPPGNKIMILGDNVFSPNVDSQFLILHEIGHRFDFNRSGGDPDKYKSNLFVKVFSPNCNTGFLGCLGVNPNPAYTHLNEGSHGGGPGEYNPSDISTSPYALKSGSIDDFADSYAYYLYTKNNLTPPIKVSDFRKFMIATWIDLGSK